MTPAQRVFLLPFLLLLAGCFPEKPYELDDSAVVETDADTDGDTDADSDADTDTDGYHPDGWGRADQHGLAAKLQDQDCTACHGSDLTGGSSGWSCDACHPSGWRTDCTFCHGGTESDSGAPPEDIDDATTGISFPEHGAHGVSSTHPDWDCDQCHVKPLDITSTGHLFVGDTTAGVAEVDMSAGLSRDGAYAGNGSCGDLYCHGNGRGEDGEAHTGDRVDCGSCHGDASSTRDMSGEHGEHLHEGVQCGDCHADTVSGNSTITDGDRHVDGRVDVAIDGTSWNGSTCSGRCHGEDHDNERWEGGDDDDDDDDDE